MMVCALIAYVVLGYFIYKMIKSAIRTDSNLYFKWLIIASMILYYIPLILYFFDRFDLFSNIGYLRNVDSDRWFDFVSSYICAVVGTLLSGFILILITFKQMSVQKNDMKESKRIENAPLLVYNFSDEYIDDCLQELMLNPSAKNSDNYSLFLEIENIGLNHAKCFSCDVSMGKNYIHNFSFDHYQPIIKKNGKVNFELIFWFKYKKSSEDNNVIINFSFRYMDVLNNKYTQKVVLKCRITNEYGSQYRGYRLAIDNVMIEDENIL